ncbi:MAG TPA: hypothetical protein DCL54_16770 [Alphaproteobacteria bacterium]|nr:hypothetical protein [Alphaproteobacteria bacterium]HAJ48228.1 hypothetical protein [Alphaproteobacteria bacterium]
MQDGHHAEIAIYRARDWPAFTWPIFTLVFIFLGIYFTFLCDPPYPVLGGASFFLSFIFALLIYFRFASFQSISISKGVLRRGKIAIRGGAKICIGNSAHIKNEKVAISQVTAEAVEVDEVVVTKSGEVSILVRVVRIIFFPIFIISRIVTHRVDLDGWFVYVPTKVGPVILFSDVAEDEALMLARLVATALMKDKPLTPPHCFKAEP